MWFELSFQPGPAQSPLKSLNLRPGPARSPARPMGPWASPAHGEHCTEHRLERHTQPRYDTATEKFTQAILDAAHKTIPTKTILIRPGDKPWITRHLKLHMKKRDRLFKKAKRTDSTHDWEAWRLQRNCVTKLNKEYRDQHTRQQVQRLLSHNRNPYQYHKILRQTVTPKHCTNIPPLETNSQHMAATDEEKAAVLNNHFAAQTQTPYDTDSSTTRFKIKTCTRSQLNIRNRTWSPISVELSWPT